MTEAPKESYTRADLPKMKRVIVKVGTAVVTTGDGSAALGRIGGVVEQISKLLQEDKEVILVTSGSVGLGIFV